MSLYIVEAIILVSLLYYYFTRTFNFWRYHNVKGPTPIPFFGNFKDVILRKKYPGVFYREVYEQYPHEKVVGIYRMLCPALLIRDPDIIKQLLIKDFEACPDRGMYFSKEKLGDNIFHTDACTWRILRNQFTSLFTTSKLKNRFHLLNDRANLLVDYIAKVTVKYPEQDMYRLFQKYTAATAMSFLFDIDVDSFDDNNKFFNVIDKAIAKLSYGNEMDLFHSGILTKLNMSLLPETVVQFCRDVIQAGVNRIDVAEHDISSLMDVLMYMRRHGEIFNNKQSKSNKNTGSLTVTDNVLAGQVFAYYLAGYGNNTLTLTYTMYYLALHPEIQDKLIAEIDRVLEEHNGELTLKSLHEIEYLSNVFDECLRIHPLANSLTRSVHEDIKMNGTDIIIKKDTTLIVSPFGIQHDKKYYPEPEKFIPERFSLGNMKGGHPCAYLPFGVGPRSCPGTKFAKLQYGVCMVRIFSKYRVEKSQNTIQSITGYDPCRLLLTPKERIYLRLVPRNYLSEK